MIKQLFTTTFKPNFKLLISSTIIFTIFISLFYLIFIKSRSSQQNANNQSPPPLHPSLYHKNDGYPYKPYEMGNNQQIPRIIHQTFKSKTRNEMTSGMRNATQSWFRMQQSSNFEYVYYNDDAVLQFLIENFGEDSDEVFAFNGLIPAAFKIDFWRLAVLYQLGGFYSDVDSILLKDVNRWIENNATMVLPVGYASYAWFGFDFAFIGSVPKHPLLRIAMDMIIYNVKNKFIPEVPRKLVELDFFLGMVTVSGPVLMGKAFNRYVNEPDEAPHNIVKGRSMGVQFLGFCDDREKYFTTIPHQRKHKECRGEIVIKFKYEEYRQERRTFHTPYWKDFREGKIFK